MKQRKSHAQVVSLVAFAFCISCFLGCAGVLETLETASTPKVSVAPAASVHIKFPTNSLSAPDFYPTEVNVKDFQGETFLQVVGKYGREFYGWNIGKEQMASKIYERIIPNYVRQITNLAGPDFDLQGFDITVKTNIVTDQQMLFNEDFYHKTGKRVGPFPAPRDIELFEYYVSADVAKQYTEFRINTSELRANMMIIIGNSKRIP
jgi:hypothetical protein